MPTNSQTGQQYVVQKAPGGAWHIYPNGRKVFVRAGIPHPQAPVPSPTPPAPASTPGVLTPDSEYFTGQAQSTFDVGQKLGDLDEEGRLDRSNYDEALRRMADNQRQSTKNTNESFNKQGLFYSGKLGTAQGDVAKEYARQRADALQGITSRENARAASRRALQSGATIDEAAAAGAAADRQIGRDTEAADNNALTLNPATSPSLPKTTAVPSVRKAKPRPYRVGVARGKVFHIYNNGRRVAVRKAR